MGSGWRSPQPRRRRFEYLRIAQEYLDDRQDALAQQNIDYCQARMGVAASHQDRVKALTTQLFPNGFSGHLPPGLSPQFAQEELWESELRWWAIEQLGDMHTAEADRVLTLYFSAVDRLDRDNPLHHEAYWQLETMKEKWKAYGKRD